MSQSFYDAYIKMNTQGKNEFCSTDETRRRPIREKYDLDQRSRYRNYVKTICTD